MKLNQKGLATIITVMIYILLSVAVLAIVIPSAITLITSTRDRGNYKTMLNDFIKFKTAVEDVVVDKKTIELTINNPGEIIIDCNNNKIIGEVDYKEEYKSEPVAIEDIITYLSQNKIHFEYRLNNYTRLKLDCNYEYLARENKSLELTKGKNRVTISYNEYDEENDNILINVYKSG